MIIMVMENNMLIGEMIIYIFAFIMMEILHIVIPLFVIVGILSKDLITFCMGIFLSGALLTFWLCVFEI
jgi:hypothetical protein